MVIKDLMDIMHPHSSYTAEGIFYKTRPLNSNSSGIPFHYSYIEARTKQYTRIFENVSGEAENIAIQTDERIDVKPDVSFMQLADGRLYMATDVMYDRAKAPQQALRLFANPVGTQQLIRMQKFDDPFKENDDG